jgi:CRP/FNR family cyclic AMP-dependent transcriptional regulator
MPLFADIDPRDILELEALCVERRVPKNTLVISEGDETDSLYVLLEGSARALRTDDSGRQFVVNRFEPWDHFGEMSLFDRDERCATVITKTRCTLLVLPRKAFFDFAATRPGIYRNMIKTLLEKLRKATLQIEELAFLDVYGRLVRFLIENQDDDGVIREKLTQQDLADIVGSTRETVNRIYNELGAGGYLTREKGHLKILKKLPYSF